MTFTDAMTQAKAGCKITRGNRNKLWLEYDNGSQCLTLHDGQPYRVRWVPSKEDTEAEDWAVLSTEGPEYPIPAYGKVMDAVLQLRDMWKQRAENAEEELRRIYEGTDDARR